MDKKSHIEGTFPEEPNECKICQMNEERLNVNLWVREITFKEDDTPAEILFSGIMQLCNDSKSPDKNSCSLVNKDIHSILTCIAEFYKEDNNE